MPSPIRFVTHHAAPAGRSPPILTDFQRAAVRPAGSSIGKQFCRRDARQHVDACVCHPSGERLKLDGKDRGVASNAQQPIDEIAEISDDALA